MYLEARHLLSQIPDHFPQKHKFEAYLEKVNQKLEMLKHMPEKKQEKKPEKKQEKKATPAHKPPAKADPNDERQLYIQGVYEMFHGDKEKAIQDFKKVLELNPKNASARIRLKEAMAK
jgi:tetratricopeptide (TPR) repeat protein